MSNIDQQMSIGNSVRLRWPRPDSIRHVTYVNSCQWIQHSTKTNAFVFDCRHVGDLDFCKLFSKSKDLQALCINNELDTILMHSVLGCLKLEEEEEDKAISIF